MKENFFSEKVLCLSYLCAMVMVALEVSFVVAAFAFGIIFWRYGAEKWRWPRLNKIFTGVLSVLVLIQVLLEFRTLIGQEPSYTLLLGLSALRVMEYDSSRDRRFIVLLGFVLLAVKALFTIDIYWILPTALCFVGFWYSLLPKILQKKKAYLFKIFLRALPVAVFLFVVFPRVVIPWAMTRGNPQGEIGFSEELNPGAVANLASTDKVAFRARFLSTPKALADLYWRGSVLNRSQGLSWKPMRQLFQPQDKKEGDMEPTYEVALDATNKVFLFVLEPTNLVRTQDLRVLRGEAQQFRLQRPLQKAIVYQGFFGETLQPPAADEQDLQIPKLTGLTLNWVEEQKSKNLSAEEKLEALKNLYSHPEFAYTLSPGVYGSDEMNEFLFERRRGFCEHFAGSYATLARALGLPARVVIGYHGGVYNQWGEFWRVSQKDAHAWVDVLIQNRWQRVDPTSWVAPLRLRIGAEDFFGLSEADQKAFARSLDFRPQIQNQLFDFDDISFWMESLNYRWIYLLIEFDLEAQADLLKSFLDFRWILLGLLTGAAVIYVLLSRRRRPLSQTPAEKILLATEVWGQKNSHPRLVSETPLQYFQRLSKICQGQAFERAAEAYEELAYRKRAQMLPLDPLTILRDIQKAQIKS